MEFKAEGIVPALITPFEKDFKLNIPAMRN
jgi:dihydrodipicolinate synthase/N-acetylneuraminate lyase